MSRDIVDRRGPDFSFAGAISLRAEWLDQQFQDVASDGQAGEVT
jgi:hypothetical protein